MTTNLEGYDPRLLEMWYKKISSTKSSPRRVKETLVGIELEYEGSGLFYGDTTPLRYWQTHTEGSLRDGIEYVLQSPIRMSDLSDALDELETLTSRAKFKNSIRTSTHIHVNALPYTILDIYKVLVAYYLVENVLVRLHGKEREGNLHCLRLKDAQTIATILSDEISSGDYFSSWQNNYRYAALNLSALKKFGSFEFRFLKALTKKSNIERWVRALVSLVENAAKFEEPKAIMNLYYNKGYKAVLKALFEPSFCEFILERITEEEMKEMMAENTAAIYEIISGLLYTHKRLPPLLIVTRHEDLPVPEGTLIKKKAQNTITTSWEEMNNTANPTVTVFPVAASTVADEVLFTQPAEEVLFEDDEEILDDTF